MASESGATSADLGRYDARADTDFIKRRHKGNERVYATTPGKSTASIVWDDFDLSHLEWQDRGNCLGTDPEAFFPLPGEGVTGTVRAICDACPVQETCLEYAVERPQLLGIWGGVSEEERRRIRKKRGIATQPRTRHAAP